MPTQTEIRRLLQDMLNEIYVLAWDVDSQFSCGPEDTQATRDLIAVYARRVKEALDADPD